MKRGDLVRVKLSGKLGIFLQVGDGVPNRALVKLIDSMLVHEFLIEDLELMNEDR